MFFADLVLLVVVWCAAFVDIRKRKVPNWLVLTLVVTGMSVQTLLHGLEGAAVGMSGLFVGMAVLLPGYLGGATGAGDVKLMGAVGTFMGVTGALMAAVASLIVGAVIALGFMLVTLFVPTLQTPWQRYGLMVRSLVVTGRPVYLKPAAGEIMGRRFPFAVSIAAGTTATVVYPWLGSGAF
ncbi:prepilin peptidase [Proteobacteria bacterium 005FR1]|nr:prepilin peptidase [Proteobacteria bacterium 005FR1]